MDFEPRIVLVDLRVAQICSALFAPVCSVLLLSNAADAKSDQMQLAQTIVKVRPLRELARSSLTVVKDFSRVMNRLKALYRSCAIPGCRH
jgi:hypothetical protein